MGPNFWSYMKLFIAVNKLNVYLVCVLKYVYLQNRFLKERLSCLSSTIMCMFAWCSLSFLPVLEGHDCWQCVLDFCTNIDLWTLLYIKYTVHYLSLFTDRLYIFLMPCVPGRRLGPRMYDAAPESFTGPRSTICLSKYTVIDWEGAML